MAAPPRSAGAATLVAGLVCLACLLALPADAASRFSDVAQGVAALAAAAGAARRAARSADRRARAPWVLVAAACTSWALGEAYWCWYALRTDDVPFPSLADVGFLGFSVLMALGLLVHPARGGRRAFLQRMLDGLMTAAAVGLVSWLTVLGAVAGADDTSRPLERALLLAYPSSDVLLVVLTVLLLSRAPGRQTALHLVGAGVVALGVSDSAFAYLGAVGLYDGGLIDLGWIGGFLLIALAGACPVPEDDGTCADVTDGFSLSASPLPYVPVLVSLGVVIALTVAGRSLTQVEMLTSCGIVLCLLARQYLAVRDNAELAGELAARSEELRRQAFFDSLTGLANRALFRDRLEHVLELHARDGRPVAVVYLDLDGFKLVNDSYGHATGDELLVRVAERIAGATRAGDTVARLGGDEFAVILETATDPREAAERITAALAHSFSIAGAQHSVGASVGVAAVGVDDPPVTADALLACSDAAMYAAKRARGSSVVHVAGAVRDVVVRAGVPTRV